MPRSAFSCTITAGAITGACQIPDASQTIPANILYAIQIIDTATQKSFTLQQVPNITGTNWALDHYGPPATTTNVPAAHQQPWIVDPRPVAIAEASTSSIRLERYIPALEEFLSLPLRSRLSR